MRRLLCFCLPLFCVLFIAVPSLGEDVTYYEAPKQIVVSFTGDCTLGCTPAQRSSDKSFDAYIEKYGMAYPFEKVREIFENDDLTVVNLENVFYDHEANKADKKYNFRGPVSYVEILKLGGVDAVSLGNNHVLDYGAYGLHSTIDTLEEAGIPWFCLSAEATQTYIFEKDGVKIGFYSAYIGEYWADHLRERTKKCFQDLKDAGCAAIVGCIHGGVEYNALHDPEYVEKMSNSLIKFGADVVICHHPHTLQGMRVQDGHTTLWSLGNFVFGGNPDIRTNNMGESVNSTVIAQITFSFSEKGVYLGHQLNLIPCHMSGHEKYNDYQPCLVSGAEAQKVLNAIQRDTTPKSYKLSPYQEGLGALQPFVPAP